MTKSDKLRNAIRQKFIDEGYTEAADLENADFAINKSNCPNLSEAKINVVSFSHSTF